MFNVAPKAEPDEEQSRQNFNLLYIHTCCLRSMESINITFSRQLWRQMLQYFRASLDLKIFNLFWRSALEEQVKLYSLWSSINKMNRNYSLCANWNKIRFRNGFCRNQSKSRICILIADIRLWIDIIFCLNPFLQSFYSGCSKKTWPTKILYFSHNATSFLFLQI